MVFVIYVINGRIVHVKEYSGIFRSEYCNWCRKPMVEDVRYYVASARLKLKLHVDCYEALEKSIKEKSGYLYATKRT